MFLVFLAALTAPSEPPPVIRVGTYSYPRYDRKVALGPLARMIARISGRPAQILLLDTPDALADAMCNGDVDVAMTNLGAFVKIRECPKVSAVAVLDTPAPVLERYRGVLLSRRDVGVADLMDLQTRAGGLRYSEVLPGSTSGALVQADALRSIGAHAAPFMARRHAGTHEAVLEDLLAGRADVGALAEEPWHKLQADNPAGAARLALLWRSAPLPPGPVVCRASAIVDCDAIRSELLGPAGAEAAAALSLGWTETAGATRFQAFDPARYDMFKAQ